MISENPTPWTGQRGSAGLGGAGENGQAGAHDRHRRFTGTAEIGPIRPDFSESVLSNRLINKDFTDVASGAC